MCMAREGVFLLGAVPGSLGSGGWEGQLWQTSQDLQQGKGNRFIFLRESKGQVCVFPWCFGMRFLA